MKCPDVNLADGAENPGIQNLGGAPRIIGAGILDAALGDDPFGRQQRLPHLADLADGVGDRFGAVDVLLHADGCHQQNGVHVVRDGDDQRVKVPGFLIEHLPVIVVAAGGRVGVEHLGGVIVVQVAQGDDLLLLAPFQVIAAHAADAHCGDGQGIAGSLVAGAPSTCRGTNSGASPAASTVRLDKASFDSSPDGFVVIRTHPFCRYAGQRDPCRGRACPARNFRPTRDLMVSPMASERQIRPWIPPHVTVKRPK